MSEENINSEALPEAGDVAAADGGESVEQANALELLNKTLGKDFKDLDTALKSVKDTYNYVGKAGQERKELEAKIEETKASSDPAVLEQLKALQDDLFYSKNPQFEDYRDVISSMGKSPAEVVQTDTFKKIFEKASGYDQLNAKKSVLQSNPKLGAVSNKMEEARSAMNKAFEAGSTGNVTNTVAAMSQAKKSAVEAVIEANEMR